MNDPFFRSEVSRFGLSSVDEGLRTHLQKVFRHMGLGLALTGIVAWLVANTGVGQAFLGSPFRLIAIFAPFIFLPIMTSKARSANPQGLLALFWGFCGTMGLSMGSLFLTFSSASIAQAFFITATTFGAMSLLGYATKKDLTKLGGFLLMGVIGIMLASIANLFFMSGALQWVLSVAGVVIFTGLTAWDVQRIKNEYRESNGAAANDTLAVFGALSLYMNFINAFQYILALTGGRRD